MELSFTGKKSLKKFEDYFSKNAMDGDIYRLNKGLKVLLNYIQTKSTCIFCSKSQRFNTEKKILNPKRFKRNRASMEERFEIIEYAIRILGAKRLLPKTKNRVDIFDPFDIKFVKITKLVTNE